jgi:creatinine amidohydrolase
MSGGSTPRRWAELSSPGLSMLLGAERDLVGLVPVGATEQHGPHLPVGTDTIVAEELCLAVSRGGDSLVLPTLACGASQWHGTAMAGTLALAGEDVAHLAVASVRWAACSGLTKVLFVNGHVGNSPALSLACDRLRFEQPDLQVGVVEWWRLGDDIAAEAVSDAEDWHANRAETALMLALRPDLVDLAAARTADDEDRATGLVFRYGAARVTTNGVTGSPSTATTDDGIRLWRAVVEAATALVARARIECPPLSPPPTGPTAPARAVGRGAWVR